ncbi:hypothetical protein [Methylobacter sp. BlB1]|uniref:hypothetical protein n=1 Tax=Methylobacter sp. BlB1 TaxID=2785914 RepID=UPI001E360563|nr:hypothetical protein [Methylobacter sp. BlB1]
MKPALAALFLWPAVPGDGQGLQPSARKLDQILLERREAEGVLDLEIGKPAVRAVSVHQITPVLAEEPGNHAVLPEFGAEKIPQHRPLIRLLHGEVVV